MLLTSFIRCLQNACETLGQQNLFGLDELSARLRDVQYIDCLPSFGANQRQVEIAAVLREGTADSVEQSGTVIGNDLEHRILSRVVVVDGNRVRLAVKAAAHA